MVTQRAPHDFTSRLPQANTRTWSGVGTSAAHAAMHGAGVLRVRSWFATAAYILSLCCMLVGACGAPAKKPESAAPRVFVPPPLHGFDPRLFRASRALSVQRGVASFYADRFSGRTTANGEAYDPRAYTAAHRTLPLGTIVRVVLVRSGEWVLVRINDRGPYAARQRVIDLSRQAARRLSMLRAGLARVRLEVLQLGRGRRLRASQARALVARGATPVDG